jgi:hypothetical protein
MDSSGACDVTSMSTYRYTTAPGAGVSVALLAPIVVLTAACSGSGSSGGSGGSSSAGGSSASASAVAYSACMRNHGVRNFPDPQRGGQVPKGDAQQFGVSTSQYQAAQRACQHLIPNTGDTAEQQQELQCAQTSNCLQAVVQQWMSGLRDLARCLRTRGRFVPAVIGTAAPALLAACRSGGGSSTGSRSSSAGGSSTARSAVAYAACMRSHEVPCWPDPTTISRAVPGLAISVSKDAINPRSAQIRATDQERERLTGSPAPRDVSP